MKTKKPEFNVLIFDIEIVGGGFGADGTTLFTFGWKFVGDKKAQTLTLPLDFAQAFTKDHFNDKPILQKLYAIFNKADISVAHFGSMFDMPYLRTKMLQHRMPPLSEPYLIDTWRVAKQFLKFRNNRLDTLIRGLGTKTSKTHFDIVLWKKAEHGDIKCAKMIDKHCIADVFALEEVYLLLKDVIMNHPISSSSIKKGDRCINCGGKLYINGKRKTRKKQYTRYRCHDCGAHFRGQDTRWSF